MNKAFLSFIVLFLLFYSCENINLKNKNVQVEKPGREIFINENGDTVVFYYRDDGSIRSKVTINNRYKNGPAFNYYKDGTVQHELNYRNGLKHGLVRYYYESGELYRETTYVNGDKEGIRRIYYQSGEIKAEIPYKKGQLEEGTKEYSKSGRLITDYPKIEIKKIYASDNKNFYLQISLDPPKKKVIYYIELKAKGAIGRIELDRYTKNGVVNYPFDYPPSVIEKMYVKAEISTRKGTPIILSKEINLAALKNR